MLRGPEYLVSEKKRDLDLQLCAVIGVVTDPVQRYATEKLAGELGVPPEQVLFTQERIGPSGPIRVDKLMTLPINVDPLYPRQIYGTHDPRAGKVGARVRRWGIDELPQLEQIKRGEMSFTGMRPQLDEEWERYQEADPWLFNDWSQIPGRTGLITPAGNWRKSVKVMNPAARRETMRRELHWAETVTHLGNIALILRTPPEVLLRSLLPKFTPKD